MLNRSKITLGATREWITMEELADLIAEPLALGMRMPSETKILGRRILEIMKNAGVAGIVTLSNDSPDYGREGTRNEGLGPPRKQQ